MEITVNDLWEKYKYGEIDFTDAVIVDPGQFGLSGKLLYQIILINTELRKLKLKNLDLTASDLTNANLEGSDLQGSKLIRANLSNANLTKVNLRGANLFAANLENINLNQAIFTPDTIFPLDFDPIAAGAYLLIPRAQLQNADLSEADLSNLKLMGANLEGANLNHAVLNNCDLNKANLENANLEAASLESVILKQANLKAANLTKACINFVDFTESDLTETNLTEVWVKRWGADFSYAQMRGANLSRVNLGEQAEFVDTDLRYANLYGSKLWRAELSGADLSHADLRYADLRESSLARAKLEGAKLEGVNFDRANLTGTILEDTGFASTQGIPVNNPPPLNSSSNNSFSGDFKHGFGHKFPSIVTDQDLKENYVTTKVESGHLPLTSTSALAIAQALDEAAVMFVCPSIIRVSGECQRESYHLDFLVCYQGRWGALIIDEIPSALTTNGSFYQERDHLLYQQGIPVIEHYPPEECLESPQTVVQNFLEILKNK